MQENTSPSFKDSHEQSDITETEQTDPEKTMHMTQQYTHCKEILYKNFKNQSLSCIFPQFNSKWQQGYIPALVISLQCTPQPFSDRQKMKSVPNLRPKNIEETEDSKDEIISNSREQLKLFHEADK